MAARDVIVLHENSEWVVPLHEAFAARGAQAQEWFLDEGIVPFSEIPADAVYYNRMSASSHTRGHRFAPELTRMVLTWLESNQRTVVNGTRALALEVCKLSQYAALQRVGIRTPKTHAVVGQSKLIEAAAAFAHWPLIVKPNRGGKGLGVQRFDSLEQLRSYLSENDIAEPLDGIWLLQEYIQPMQNHITRSEFVGQQFIYAVNVNTDDGFELCPADVCSIVDAFCPAGEQAQKPEKFTITDAYDQHPTIAKLEQFMAMSGVDVAGIEFIELADGELCVYDVNTNTNYNQAAEQRAQVSQTGMGAIADYLLKLAQN